LPHEAVMRGLAACVVDAPFAARRKIRMQRSTCARSCDLRMGRTLTRATSLAANWWQAAFAQKVLRRKRGRAKRATFCGESVDSTIASIGRFRGSSSAGSGTAILG
jgi:hypothetical protein